MLKNEINSMLSSLIDSNKLFNKFYKAGYFPYTKDKTLKGAIAIVNDKAIVSFLQETDDENKVIATASFQDDTTYVFHLIDDDFCKTEFGNLPNKWNATRDSVIDDISSIRKHCEEAKEKMQSNNPCLFNTLFSKVLNSKGKKLSKNDVKSLLEGTLDKLHNSEFLNKNNRNEIFPKIDTSNISTNDNSIAKSSIPVDKTHEENLEL